jgi:ABC-type branched-subunit amino acid transport system ATPase component
MEHRTSVLVSAGPAFAGKTTLLNALLDFLPPDLQKISLQGYFEDFRFLNNSKPEKSYLVAEEISNHGFAEYLLGHKAVKAFNLLSRGYHLGSTMHARTSEETIYVLNKYLGLPLPLLSHLDAVNLRATAAAL